MRQCQSLGLELEVAKQQQIDVQRPGPVARTFEHPPPLQLNCLADVKQLLGIERGRDPHHGVEEVGLVQDLADRLGLVGRGDRLYLDTPFAEQLDGGSQMALAVADVRAQAKKTGAGQLGSSSSPSASSDSRARTTSTATSSIANGIGGSGLAARTRTWSEPKRSISRSATTLLSRSSVR